LEFAAKAVISVEKNVSCKILIYFVCYVKLLKVIFSIYEMKKRINYRKKGKNVCGDKM